MKRYKFNKQLSLATRIAGFTSAEDVVNPETGEVSERHKSPKRGKSWQILRELYALCPIMPLKNVCFKLIFVNTEEYRVLSGRSRDKKHFGAARYERIPTELCDIITLNSAEDFAALIPTTLGENFTAAEFAKAAKMTPRAAGYAMRVLVTLGVIEHTANEGRAYVYTRKKELLLLRNGSYKTQLVTH